MEPVQKKPGRPPVPPEKRRSARLQMRVFPDVADKAARVGTAAVEAAIRKIKESNLVKF
jgi:hypothetical protein